MLKNEKTDNFNVSHDSFSIENKPRKKLIDDVNFEKLLKLYDEVFQATDISPSIGKVINLIVEQSDLEAIKNQLISKLT